MSFQLQPTDIADCFSLVAIEAKIASILASITLAEQSVKDVFGDGQANQSVQRQELGSLYDSLAVWIKAKNILNGTDSSAAVIVTPNYNPSIPKV